MKTTTLEDLKKERRFVLTRTPNKYGEPYNPVEFIPGECEVYDSTTDRVRTAVYLPGVHTIWADEIESLKGKDRIIGKKILFNNGWKIVSPKEANLLKYLLVAGYNEKNEDTRVNSAVLYKEWAVETLAKNKFEDNKRRDDAVYFVNNADIREVRAYALALAKNRTQVENIQQASEFEIRLGLRPIAEKNPEKFIEAMQEVSLRHKVRIIQAIYSDIILWNEKDRTLSWKGGDTFITAPIGMDVIDYFASMSVDAPKFKDVYDAIIARMNGGKVEKQKVEKQEIEEEEEEKSIQDTLLDLAVEKGVITGGKKNMWFVYGETKFKTRTDILKALKEDKELAEEIFNKTK